MMILIWIEPVNRVDGSNWYTDRGLLLRTRLGGPDGEILCDRVHNAVCETCRVLMSRGITGPFETRKEAVLYACMRGDIERTAGLTVEEGSTKSPQFRRWEPHPTLRMPFPVRAGRRQRARTKGPVGGGAADVIACPSDRADQFAETVE
jgi:hypothetical protein